MELKSDWLKRQRGGSVRIESKGPEGWWHETLGPFRGKQNYRAYRFQGGCRISSCNREMSTNNHLRVWEYPIAFTWQQDWNPGSG